MPSCDQVAASADRVPIRYEVQGSGSPALVFALKRKQPLTSGGRNGEQNAQHHQSQRRAREADNVPWTDPAIDDGGSQGQRRTIGFLPRRRPFYHQVLG